MIVIAFALFAVLVIAWLSAPPSKQSVPKAAPAPMLRSTEATA